MRTQFFHLWSVLGLLTGLVGCDTTGSAPVVEKPLAVSSKAPVSSVVMPHAPPIYAAGMTWQQGRKAQKIGVPLAVVQEQLVGEGDDPIWNYSDMFDNPHMANAIDLALLSKNNSKVMELGGERALEFVERLEALNASFSDLPATAGISESPVRYVVSGNDFRYQIALKERGIGAALSAYPEISRAYVKWLFKVADIADQDKAGSSGKTAP